MNENVVQIKTLSMTRRVAKQLPFRHSISRAEFESVQWIGRIGYDAIENGSSPAYLACINGQYAFYATSAVRETLPVPQIVIP